MASALNADGLRLWYGAEEAREAIVFESSSDGQSRVTEIRVDHSNLPVTGSNDEVISYDYRLPNGAVISGVEILVYEDFDSAGDAMTLNVGITDADGGTTIFDTDALVVAATQTELNAGGENVAGWVGTRVNGTPLEEDVFLTWEVDTADATAGSALIRVYWSMPFPTTDTLVWSKA